MGEGVADLEDLWRRIVHEKSPVEALGGATKGSAITPEANEVK